MRSLWRLVRDPDTPGGWLLDGKGLQLCERLAPGWLAAASLSPDRSHLVYAVNEEPYLARVDQPETPTLLGHGGVVEAVAVSPDGRVIASGSNDGTIRLWPMPDLHRPPLHDLPRAEFLARLRSLTNLRVVRDPEDPDGYRVAAGPFPGWQTAPEW